MLCLGGEAISERTAVASRAAAWHQRLRKTGSVGVSDFLPALLPAAAVAAAAKIQQQPRQQQPQPQQQWSVQSSSLKFNSSVFATCFPVAVVNIQGRANAFLNVSTTSCSICFHQEPLERCPKPAQNPNPISFRKQKCLRWLTFSRLLLTT